MVLQRVFEDALHGRSERYREWLDVVDLPRPAAAPAEADGQRITGAAG
jgi:hypothetical protein